MLVEKKRRRGGVKYTVLAAGQVTMKRQEGCLVQKRGPVEREREGEREGGLRLSMMDGGHMDGACEALGSRSLTLDVHGTVSWYLVLVQCVVVVACRIANGWREYGVGHSVLVSRMQFHMLG